MGGAAFVVLAAACGGSGVTSSMGDLAAPLCNDPNPPDGGVCGVPVSGRVVGDTDAAVTSLTVSVCAGDCFFGKTGGDGRFVVLPDLHILLDQYALELHGQPDHVSYYAPLPAAGGSGVVFASPLLLPSLPPSGAPIANDASAQTLTSSDVTLTLTAGTHVLFDVEDFGTPHGHDLRVVPIDSPAKLPFIDAAAPPAALYALAPFETGFDQKAALTLVNRAHLPAGSAVDLQMMTGLLNDTPPAGHFQHVAAAHVAADGATIQTDAGEGIRELTWLAVKGL
jgi:hypothetical protein